MVVKCSHVGVSKRIVSKKDGKEYEIHLFEDVNSRLYQLPFLCGSFPIKDSYYIESYKSSEGTWRSHIIDVE